jgi:penicillin-binding protein 1C
MSRRSVTWRRVLIGLLLFALAVRFWPREPLSRELPVSTVLWSADGEVLRVTLASDDQYRIWTPLSEMSPLLVRAFLLKEDRWFYWHLGVNPLSLGRAVVRTYRGHTRQGGSTITMQLARLLYRFNTRTPAGKLRQAAAALWLEARYSKREILEAYLNAVPFGGNIQGVGAAARIYFGKPSSRITLAEALTLGVIPQRPSARTDRQAARSRLAALWNPRDDSERRQLALTVPLPEVRFALPWLAPHFADAFLHQRLGPPGRVDTTLDAALQRVVEGQIERYRTLMGDRGIHNAAALLVDTRDLGVKAWVGSADYWDEEIDGQVSGVTAKRSPGSTLKPFIYALALDQGVLHPRTILRDAPTSFGSFTPENFDGRFFGPLPAEEALIRSRNVPAVWVTSRLKQPSLYQFLQSSGVSRLEPEEHYGLSLALGGGEVSMEELATLYAMLANQGVLRPLRVEANAPLPEPTRLLSAEAAFVTLDMLRHNPRPDDVGEPPLRSSWPVAWKTGTSWGFRDAWSAGVVGPYVLVVWIGNFSGQGNPSFVGVEAAAPLFFRISDAIHLARPAEPALSLKPPPGVSRVAVCAASGDLPNAYCPQTVETWYLPGKSPIQVSRLHRAVSVDIDTGRPACPPFDPDRTRQEIFEFWPAGMLKSFREAGMPRRGPPRMPACASDESRDGPAISSPLRGVRYRLRESRPEETIALDAAIAADVHQVFWFDGSALLGQVSGGALPWRPTSAGVHLLRVIDDHGRVAEREVKVDIE